MSDATPAVLTAEEKRAELRRIVTAMKSSGTFPMFTPAAVVELLDTIDAQAAEIDRRRADSERLDWLDEQREGVASAADPQELECYAWGVYGQCYHIRDAIDDAIVAPPAPARSDSPVSPPAGAET